MPAKSRLAYLAIFGPRNLDEGGTRPHLLTELADRVLRRLRDNRVPKLEVLEETQETGAQSQVAPVQQRQALLYRIGDLLDWGKNESKLLTVGGGQAARATDLPCIVYALFPAESRQPEEAPSGFLKRTFTQMTRKLHKMFNISTAASVWEFRAGALRVGDASGGVLIWFIVVSDASKPELIEWIDRARSAAGHTTAGGHRTGEMLQI